MAVERVEAPRFGWHSTASRFALIEFDRRAEGHRLATHDFVARICQRQKVPTMRAAAAPGLGSANSEQNGGESQRVRWTCTYHGLAGANGRAAFDCVEKATRFADLHANLTGAPQASGTGIPVTRGFRARTWGRYMVCPTNTSME